MLKVAKGEIRRLLIGIGEIQDLVGRASGYAMDDRSQNAHEIELNSLDEAFNLCVSLRSEYEPIKDDEDKWERRKRIYLLHQSGVKYKDIAEEMNISASRVSQLGRSYKYHLERINWRR